MRLSARRNSVVLAELAAAQEPKRPTAEARALGRDMRQLEELRKLRRERAELALRDARIAVQGAQRHVVVEHETVLRQTREVEARQHEVSGALAGGGRLLKDVQQLLSRVGHAQAQLRDAHSMLGAARRAETTALVHATEVSVQTQAAAAAHEKVLEWKKSA